MCLNIIQLEAHLIHSPLRNSIPVTQAQATTRHLCGQTEERWLTPTILYLEFHKPSNISKCVLVDSSSSDLVFGSRLPLVSHNPGDPNTLAFKILGNSPLFSYPAGNHTTTFVI